jgi:hypothetical protein
MFAFALSLAQWSEIAEIFAGVGVAFVAAQVWLGVRNSRVELITGMTVLITQVDQAFIEHPQMWKYFNAGVLPPARTETEGEKARVIAITMANVLDHVVEHQRKMKRRTRKAWQRYIADLYAMSPVLQEVLGQHIDWWPGLQKQIRRGRP